jgi:general secretion pathway protein I
VRMGERNWRDRKGFTLLEVMIAMAILAISLVAVFRSQSQSVSMAAESRFLTTASLLAQSKMAEIENMKPQDLSNGNGGFGEDFSDYLWRIEIKDTAFQYLKKIDVIVTNSIMVTNNVYNLELYRFVWK